LIVLATQRNAAGFGGLKCGYFIASVVCLEFNKILSFSLRGRNNFDKRRQNDRAIKRMIRPMLVCCICNLKLPSRQQMRDQQEKEGDKVKVLDNYWHQDSGSSQVSGYLSTTRDIRIPLRFLGNGGWMYVLRCIDGIDVNASFHRPHSPDEKEISQAGGFDWPNVIGWRKVLINCNKLEWDKNIFLTKDRDYLPKNKREEIIKILSIPLAKISPRMAAPAFEVHHF